MRRNQDAAGKMRGAPRGDVRGAIADDPGMRQIELHPAARRKDHARARLAPGVIGDIERRAAVGVMGAGERGVEMCSGLRQRARQRGLHGMKTLPIVEPARDARLIGDQHDGNSQAVASRDGSRRAFEHAHVFRTAEIMRVLDQDAVAVEKQRRAVRDIPGGDFAPEPFVRPAHAWLP